MTNVSRNDIKKARAKVVVKVREARNVAELELVFTIGALYIAHHYDNRPIRRFFARLGARWGSSEIAERYMERAKRELSEVNYDFTNWKERYGSNNTRSLVKE